MFFGRQLFKNMITYTVWKFRKSKITHQKNEIEQNLNRADLPSSLLSVHSCKNIQQWTTDAKPIVHLLYFHSRVARIATSNLSFTTNSTACFLLLTHSTRAIHSTTRVHWLPHSALIQLPEGGQDMQDRQQVSHRTGCRTGHRTVRTCFRT